MQRSQSEGEQSHVFALKTYKGRDANKWHNAELEAFRKMGYCDRISSIVQCFSSYILDGTYNLLLEYADFGNLERYLKEVEEPREAVEIFSFWKSFLRLFDAIMKIHDLRLDSDEPEAMQRVLG